VVRSSRALFALAAVLVVAACDGGGYAEPVEPAVFPASVWVPEPAPEPAPAPPAPAYDPPAPTEIWEWYAPTPAPAPLAEVPPAPPAPAVLDRFDSLSSSITSTGTAGAYVESISSLLLSTATSGGSMTLTVTGGASTRNLACPAAPALCNDPLAQDRAEASAREVRRALRQELREAGLCPRPDGQPCLAGNGVSVIAQGVGASQCQTRGDDPNCRISTVSVATKAPVGVTSQGASGTTVPLVTPTTVPPVTPAETGTTVPPVTPAETGTPPQVERLAPEQRVIIPPCTVGCGAPSSPVVIPAPPPAPQTPQTPTTAPPAPPVTVDIRPS